MPDYGGQKIVDDSATVSNIDVSFTSSNETGGPSMDSSPDEAARLCRKSVRSQKSETTMKRCSEYAEQLIFSSAEL